jgi:hypothetical protein
LLRTNTDVTELVNTFLRICDTEQHLSRTIYFEHKRERVFFNEERSNAVSSRIIEITACRTYSFLIKFGF